MLEKYIAALLVPYLSKYVENINEDQLKINIWSGRAALNDLVLRPEALDALLSGIHDDEGETDAAAAGTSPVSNVPNKEKKKKRALPVRAHRGICKNVSLSIPIKHLRSEPVVVEVGELLLTLKGVSDPSGVNGGDGAGEDGSGLTSSDGLPNVKAEKWNAIAEAKAKELQAFEAERKRQREQKEQVEQQAAALKDGDSPSGQKGGGGFFSRLGELVINNVIVKVQTVHVRYEDEAADTVIGAVLGGVQLLTMNEATGQPMFTDPSGLQKMWKRFVFNDMQFYCDDPSRVRTNAPLGRSWYSKIDDWQQWYHRMRQRARDGAVAQSTIFGPVSGGLDAKVVFKMFARKLLDTPYADVSLKLQHVMASLTRAQYTKILQTIMLLTNQAEVSELQRMRPRVPVKGHARQWWRYVTRAVRSVLAEPRREALLARISATCKLDYQVLYRDVVRQTEMTPEKKKMYRFITRFMTTEDMKTCRKYVYAQIANEIQMKRKDNEIRKAEEMAKQYQATMQQQTQAQGLRAPEQSKRGWLSWLVGSGDAASPQGAVADTTTAKEIEEDEKFFKAIESEYGISSADSEAYQSTAVAFEPDVASGLPPSYCWLRATFELPFTSYRIDTEQGDSVTLKIFHLHGGVTSFNKSGSLLFFFRTQNITLANPAATSSSSAAEPDASSSSAAAAVQGCKSLVPYLIEGVQVNRRASKSSPTGERIAVRSLASVDCGKHLPSALEAPTIHDVVDVAGSEPPSPPLLPPPTTKISGGSSRSTSGEDDKLPPVELPAAADYATPLFSITGFLNPVEQPLADTTVDVAVKVQLLPLRIVADPATIEHLVSFFTPPAGVDVSGFAESTRQAASAVGSAASQELRAAMAKAKGLYITVDASAPVVILPKSLSAGAQETALAVSLGRVRFHARPLSETEKQRRLTAAAAVTDTPPQPTPTPTSASLPNTENCGSSTTAAAAAQEALFYYPHKASFSKFYLEVTTVEKAMRRPQRGFLLLPEVSIAADVLQRIDDRSASREAFVLRLKVPSLRVACSLHQVYLITNLADAWTSRLRTPKQPKGDSNGDGGAARGLCNVPSRSPSRSPILSESMEVPPHSEDAGGDGGDSPTPPSATRRSPPLSAAPAKAAVSGDDPPVMRLELLVQHLGLDVHDDDAETLLVSPLPAYCIECVSAELIFAVRAHHKKMVLWLKEPHIMAARDPDRPVLSCGGARVDVLILEGETPTGVAVSLDAALNLCLGTACVEMLETTMDVVNLILSALNDDGKNNSGEKGSGPALDQSFLTVADGKVDLTGSASGKALPAGMARTNSTAGGSTSRLSDLAYQINMVRQQCAQRNRHVADVFVRVQGPATITLLNRGPGETADTPFAFAAISDVEMRLSKYAVTLDLSGRVGAVSASVLDASGLVENNRTLLAYTPSISSAPYPPATPTTEDDGASSNSGGGSSPSSTSKRAKGKAKTAATTTPALPLQVSSHAPSSPGVNAEGEKADSGGSASSHSLDADATSNGHINFSFRKSRPVMPLFKEVGGKRVLANPQELRYSSALELLIGSSTITLDLNTVMIFKTYLLAGLFSRLSRLGDRPLYNGRTPPPAREGPRLLMSFRIVVRDTVVVLPVDPRQRKSHRFCASLGSFVLENSLHTAACKETMNISFGEFGMWHEEPVPTPSGGRSSSKSNRQPRRTVRHTALLPKQTYMEMAFCTPLDLLSDDAPHLDIRGEDVTLELREADLVQVVTLLRQNLMRVDQTDIAEYTVEAVKPVRQVVVGKDGKARLIMQHTSRASGAPEDASTLGSALGAMSTSFAVSAVVRATQRRNEEMYVSLRLGRVSVLLSDEARETNGSPIASSASRFRLQSSGLAMTVALPSNHIGIRWKSLQLDDVRDNSSSALLLCEEGSLRFADSLTTQCILMSDFGIRHNALRSVSLGEWKMGSLASSSSDTKQGAEANHGDGDEGSEPESFSHPDVGAEGTSKSHHSPDLAGSSTNTQLVSISVISADFTLRRLAVSDQWLALYDVTCNETVASAWTAPQTGMKATATAAAGSDATQPTIATAAAASGPAKTAGMRIFVTTPSVAIPFLNSRRETLIEANIVALLVDVARLPNASTHVAVKVRELNVVDAVSNEKIIFRRTPVAAAAATTAAKTSTSAQTSAGRSSPFPADSPVPAGAGAPDLSNAAPLTVAPQTQDYWVEGWDDVDASFSSPLGTKAGRSDGETAGGHANSGGDADEPEVLQFAFKSDPETNTNRIQLGIGALHTLVSLPVIHGLVDYFTSPCEPVAKIGSLGVMREQRARMAAAAQQMANNSHLVLHMLWRQPRIILAADGLQLRQHRSSNLEMRLGVMRAAVHLKSAASTLSVVVKVQEYSISSLLKRSALRFAYQSIRGAETIDLNMDRTTAQFHPTEVERFILLGQRNILLPRDVDYYGHYEKAAASPAASQPASPAVSQSFPAATPSNASVASPVDAAGGVSSTPVRTIQVHIDGLLVAIHDPLGLNTHTLSLSSLDTLVAADGSVEMVVPSFSLLDESTNRCLLQSKTKATPVVASPNASVAAPMASLSFANSNSNSNNSNNTFSSSLKPSAGNAVRLFFDSNARAARAHLGAVLVTVIPRSIGSLANTFLSVRIPAPAPVPAATTPDAAKQPSPSCSLSTCGPTGAEGKDTPANAEKSTPTQLTRQTSTASSSGAAAHPAATAATAADDKPFTMKVSLSECRVRFCQGEREVALLRLSDIACHSAAHPDGRNELSVTLGNLFMVDSVSVATNFRTFIYPCKDDEVEGRKSGVAVAREDQESSEGEGDKERNDAAAVTALPSPIKSTNGEDKSAPSNPSTYAPTSAFEGLVVYEVRTLPPAKRDGADKTSSSGDSTPAPTYAKQMRCRVKSLSFIFVPDVVHAVLDAVREVQAHVSEGNRDKAYHYVSDRAAKSMQRTAATEELMEVDIVVSRPQVLLVDRPTATTGVQLSPGSLILKSFLVVPESPGAAPAVLTSAPVKSSSPQLKGTMTASPTKAALHGRAEGDLAQQPREVFELQVHKLGMRLQDVSCFQKDCNILIEYQRSLAVASLSSSSRPAAPVPATTNAATTATDAEAEEHAAAGTQNSLLKVDVPVLSLSFTQPQTDFAMDVLGALLKGSAVNRTARTVAMTGSRDGGEEGRLAKSRSGAASPSAEKGGAGAGAGAAGRSGSTNDDNTRRSGSPCNGQALTTTNSSGGYGTDGRREQEHLYDPNAVVPLTTFSVDLHVGMLQADLADLFRLRVDEVHVQSTNTSTTGKTMDTRVGSILIQHVGAEIDAENGGEASIVSPDGASLAGTTISLRHPGGQSVTRRTARIQELVDLLVMTKLHVRHAQPQPSIDMETASSMAESTINISAGVFDVAVSPTILFDTRELLYLPFCYKVLRVPIDPIPVLSLTDGTTTLDGDAVLDDKHVLLTASRTRCNYVLDLNKHKLVLTGAPSGQVVLCEGCELTITNGTICIPGMYTVGSYVSFAPRTALFTTSSCKFEKEFLNVANSAFFGPIMGRPSLSPPGQSGGGNNNDANSSQSPQSTVRSSNVSAPSPSSSIGALGATLGPNAVRQQQQEQQQPAEDSVIDLRDRTVRVIANFYCDDMQLQMLSEEVVDLSVSLRMQTHLKFVQEWENEQPARRTVSMQLTSLRSGEDEEHILLPTDMVMNVSGVENVSVSLILDSMEFCTRTTLLRSLVELGKDFGAAFIEETTVSRVKPRIEYETQSLDALYPVLEAGECQHCGRDVAYLALTSNQPGILCYKCCTGYDSLPAIDFRVEVPLVDGILFGSSGDMVHLYMRNVLLSVDPSMGLQLTLRMSLYGFSNAAAVWEPMVEQFDATITGSVSTHDYRIRMDRLDYVLSPQNIRLLRDMVADYGAATALQKQLRKRFRRQKQKRTQQVAPNQGVPMYVNAALLEEVARVELQEEEINLTGSGRTDQDVSPFRPMGTTTSPMYPNLNGIDVASLANTSVFDVLNSTNRRLLAGAAGVSGGDQDSDTPAAAVVAEPPKRGYAHVYVQNHCNVPLLVEGRRVTPRGGTLRFIAKESTVKLNRLVQAEDEEQEEHKEDYVTSISNPPLYVQTNDMVLETKVLLSQEDGSRYLRRTITMTVFPLHVSHTIICFENRLHCPLASTANYPPTKPGGRFYLPHQTDLNTTVYVQPVHTPDRVEYEVGKAVGEALDDSSVIASEGAAKLPTIHDVLCGVPLVLLCKAKDNADKSMTVKMYVRQEEMRGGVPTFVITVEPRFRLRNKLPYRLIVNVLPDPNGDLARGRIPARPVPPLVSTVLDVRQGADLFLNTFRLDQVAFMLEVRQRRPPQPGGKADTADKATTTNTNTNTNNSGGGAPLAASTSLANTLRGRPSDEEEVFTTLVPTAISGKSPYISLRSQLHRELVIHVVYAPGRGSVVFATPYVLLNHSPLSLTLRECTRDGVNKLYDAERNFSVLHPEMNSSVAASPMGIKDSEDFFVNIYYQQYCGTCVPLHAQQRGVVILQDCTGAKATKSKVSSSSCSGTSRKKSDAASASSSSAAAARVGPTVIHLAYSSQVDSCGSLLVTIVPRWVVVNRSHLPLYVAPSTYNGMTAKEVSAAASTAMVASRHRRNGGEGGAAETEVSPPSSPASQQQQVDAMKSALQEMVAENSIVYLSDAPTQVTALAPYSATPFYETPLCSMEVGYNIHVLQSPVAPLYGTPVGIESIHSELIVAYRPTSEKRESQAGGDDGPNASASSPKGTSADCDRFLEVSLVVRDPYTYVVLEPPERVPFLLLNRTDYTIEVRDTASKSKGRLMARVQAGCGTDLILDPTVTTLVNVRLFAGDDAQVVYEVVFDAGRPMSRHERSAAASAPNGVTYTLGYGEFGQQLIDIAPARATLQPTYTSVAAPPIPIDVLLNLGVTTLSVVMPNRDVLFCAMTDIRFSWDRQTDREIMKFSVENFQVDNQTEVSPRYDSCILSLRTSTSFAAASGYVERVLIPAKGLICLDEVRLDFVPLALRVSDTLLVACAGFVQAVRSGDDAPGESNVTNQSMLSGSTSTVEMQEAAAAPRERCPTATTLYMDAPVQIDVWASRLTLERFIINPIVVRVWLTRDIEEHDFFRENINSKDAALLSMMVPSCEDVTIAAPGIVTAKQASRLGVFVEWVIKTYQDGLLSQLKGLLLQYASSLPMIGAPLKLASGFGNGAVRLFREPIDGLSTSPSAFAQGLARGSAGFAQEFAGGGLGAFSNVTDSWSRLLSMGGGVSEKERRRQNTLTGFANGIMGIFQRPMEGAAESGAAGFLKGTAQGLVGVVANPMSGLLSDVSRATGTLGKLVTDTYIPKTKRLRPIRDFHANGGVAPWRSLVSVYQYQRIKTSTRAFSGDQLLSSVDGPEWYPSRREGATFGRNKVPIPAERWTLDRYHTNFEGWTYSTKYYGTYSERLTLQVRVRRMRWTALVRPLPYSRVAFYLRVAPGMETQARRTASTTFSPSMTPQETNIEFTSPGQLQATTLEQTKARRRRFFGLPGLLHRGHSSGGSGSGSGDKAMSSGSAITGSPSSVASPHKKKRAASEYFAEEEYANQRKTLAQRMRKLTATGRHVGVKTAALRGGDGMMGDDADDLVVGGRTETAMYSLEDGGVTGSQDAASTAASSSGAAGTVKLTRSTDDLQGPDAPRNRRKKERHSRSASELDATVSDSGRSSSSDRESSGTTSGSEGGKKGSGARRRDKKKADAMAATTQSTRGEAPGSKVPHPGATRFARSNSGKVEVLDAAASLASVPGASPTFVSRTSGTAANPLPTTIVEIYEYEKKAALMGWSKRYLPSECPSWQDAHGNEVPCRQDIRAPAGWTWTTDWTIVGGDDAGWTMMNDQKNLRRRMWQRRLVKQPPTQSRPK